MSHYRSHDNRAYSGGSHNDGWSRGGGNQRSYGTSGGYRTSGPPTDGGGSRAGGRRSGEGSFWVRQRPQLETDGIDVQTNCYKLTSSEHRDDNKNLYQYVVHIDALMKKWDKSDATYQSKLNDTGMDVKPPPPEYTKPYFVKKYMMGLPVMYANDTSTSTDSTKLSRRILNCCQQKLQEVSQQFFIHDGTNIAYSRDLLASVTDRKLYMEYEETFEYRQNVDSDVIMTLDDTEKKKSDSEPAPKKQKKPNDVVEYIVSLRIHEDDNDSDTTVRKAWYLVSFQSTNKISMNLLSENTALVNCINTALKGNMISHCIGFGRSPLMYFFLPPEQQKAILPKFLSDKVYNSITPLLGLKQSVRYCDTYGMLLIASFGLRYMYNEVNAKTKEPYHVLQINPTGNRQEATILGDTTCKIRNVNVCVPIDQRLELGKKLKKINFHIRYYRGSQYETFLKDQLKQQELKDKEDHTDVNSKRKPLTPERIEKKKFFLKKNTRLLVLDTGMSSQEQSIIWEPHLYKFPYSPRSSGQSCALTKKDYDSTLTDTSNKQKEELVTVSEYFFRQYGYKVKYPNMPLIRVKSRQKDMKEYYPLEMLLQCQDEVKNMNDEETVQNALKLYDQWCGKKRQDKISSLLHDDSDKNPLHPFQDGQQSVLQHQFQLKLDTKQIITSARVLQEPKLLSGDKPVSLSNGSLMSIAKFATPSTMSTFAVINYAGVTAEVLWKNCFETLFPTCSQRGMKIPKEITYETFCKVTQIENEPKTLEEMCDHFKTATIGAQHHFLKNNCRLNVQSLNGVVMMCDVKLPECKTEPLEHVDVRVVGNNSIWKKRIPLNRVDCPSIVFVVFKDKPSNQIYSQVKLLSHVDFVVQSQVMNWKKAGHIKNGQYLNNLTYKLNLKLATEAGRETAWKRKTPSTGSSNWVDEVPTLIIGISMASASGQDSVMTVVGTALLDNEGLTHKQELRVQKKGPLISEKVMTEIILSLAVSWSRSNDNRIAERVIVYRATGDDGMFEDILGVELRAIKLAFHKLNKYKATHSCDQCITNEWCIGCIFCLPKITMVVAQSQHNIILAPAGNVPDDVVNVPSGTCVETLFPALNLSDDKKMNGLLQEFQKRKSDFAISANKSGDSTAFALVAHGGLKGTSKCVVYRVIWNENLCFQPKSSSDATQLDLYKLQTLTYHLSFLYGTAPKAPRFPMVLQYSARLNKVAIDYIKFLPQLNTDSVLINILGRVKGAKLEESEIFSIPHHPTSMG